mmetsp:Transcript_87348/g.120317  ORF Transcript_87348/g.120317 Transcript_87348/m.120317 type:complete len:202 (+) Transcript_87348:166-771(+)
MLATNWTSSASPKVTLRRFLRRDCEFAVEGELTDFVGKQVEPSPSSTSNLTHEAGRKGDFDPAFSAPLWAWSSLRFGTARDGRSSTGALFAFGICGTASPASPVIVCPSLEISSRRVLEQLSTLPWVVELGSVSPRRLMPFTASALHSTCSLSASITGLALALAPMLPRVMKYNAPARFEAKPFGCGAEVQVNGRRVCAFV